MMKYNIGDLLQVKHNKPITIINDIDPCATEKVKAGQFFLIIDYGPRIKNCLDGEFGYTLFCQESGTSSFWGFFSHENNDMLISNSFKKVVE